MSSGQEHKEHELHENRLSRLEAIVENIAREVGDLKDIVRARSQTNWSVLASWAAVIIAVVSLAGSGYVRDLTRLEYDARILENRIITDEVDAGKIHERLRALERQIYKKEPRP